MFQVLLLPQGCNAFQFLVRHRSLLLPFLPPSPSYVPLVLYNLEAVNRLNGASQYIP